MTEAVQGALIAGAASVVGGLVVAFSSLALYRLQAKGARRDAQRLAMVRFLSIVNQVDHRLQVEPVTARPLAPLVAVSSRLPSLTYGFQRLNTRLLNPGLDTLVVQMHEALADAVISLPLEVLPAMESVAELMQQAQSPDANWRREWEAARGALVVAFRTQAGEKVGG